MTLLDDPIEAAYAWVQQSAMGAGNGASHPRKMIQVMELTETAGKSTANGSYATHLRRSHFVVRSP
jgi:hypothetical protein